MVSSNDNVSEHLIEDGRKQLRVRVVIAIALFFLTIICGAGLVAWQSRPRSVAVRVRLKWSHQVQFAGFYVAKSQGYYSLSGLDVKLLPGLARSGDEVFEMPAIQTVASGEDQFGVSGAESILLARSKGIPIRAIAAIFENTPFCYLALSSDRISDLHDLQRRHLPVGVHLDSTDLLTYRAMLQGANPSINENDILEVPVPLGDLSALISGQVKAIPAYLINEPVELQEKYHKQPMVMPAYKYNVQLYGDTVFTTERFEAENPTIVDKFTAATIKGWQKAVEDPELAVDATIREAKADGQPLEANLEKAKMQKLIDLLHSSQHAPFTGMTYDRWKSAQQLTESRLGSAHLDIDKVFTNEHLPK